MRDFRYFARPSIRIRLPTLLFCFPHDENKRSSGLLRLIDPSCLWTGPYVALEPLLFVARLKFAPKGPFLRRRKGSSPGEIPGSFAFYISLEFHLFLWTRILPDEKPSVSFKFLPFSDYTTGSAQVRMVFRSPLGICRRRGATFFPPLFPLIARGETAP